MHRLRQPSRLGLLVALLSGMVSMASCQAGAGMPILPIAKSQDLPQKYKGLQITSDHQTFKAGAKEYFTVHCGDYDAPDKAQITSLILSKWNEKKNAPEVLAAMNPFHPSDPLVVNGMGATVTGQVTLTDEVFLKMEWPSAGDDVVGLYTCDAHTLSDTGVSGDLSVGWTVTLDKDTPDGRKINEIAGGVKAQTDALVAASSSLSAVDTKLQDQDTALQNQANAAQALMEQTIDQQMALEALKADDKVQHANRAMATLDQVVEDLKKTVADLSSAAAEQPQPVQIASGRVDCPPKSTWEDGRPEDEPDSQWAVAKIDYKASFSQPPNVQIGISYLDVPSSSPSTRVKVALRSDSNESGFVDCLSWGGSEVAGVGFDWVAIGN